MAPKLIGKMGKGHLKKEGRLIARKLVPEAYSYLFEIFQPISMR